MSKQNGEPRGMSIQFGRKRIEYQLLYAARKTLAIDVHPDLSVVVTAPQGSQDFSVEEKVHKRAAWIIEQQRFFKTYLPHIPPRQYISGETHRYLGKQFRLKVLQGIPETVKMARGLLTVTLKDTQNRDQVKTLVQSWFDHRAQLVFQELFDKWAKPAERWGIHAATFQIRKMKTRWGSCTKAGKILLNPELIIAPKQCIEYVIAHELCHLKEHNHGPRFYRLLNQLMPDWQARREKLNRCVVGT